MRAIKIVGSENNKRLLEAMAGPLLEIGPKKGLSVSADLENNQVVMVSNMDENIEVLIELFLSVGFLVLEVQQDYLAELYKQYQKETQAPQATPSPTQDSTSFAN